MLELRKCLYHGNKFWFHRWFRENTYEEFTNGPAVNVTDIGAILENKYSGKIYKVYDIEDIIFDN